MVYWLSFHYIRTHKHTDQLCQQITERTEYALMDVDALLAAFQDIDGASVNTSLDSILRATRRKGVDENAANG